MDCSDPNEVVLCSQCGWPIHIGQGWACLFGNCPDCGEYHIVGVVHHGICVMDFANGEERVRTQKRIAGMAGVN